MLQINSRPSEQRSKHYLLQLSNTLCHFFYIFLSFYDISMAYLQYSIPFIALNPNLNVNYTLV